MPTLQSHMQSLAFSDLFPLVAIPMPEVWHTIQAEFARNRDHFEHLGSSCSTPLPDLADRSIVVLFSCCGAYIINMDCLENAPDWKREDSEQCTWNLFQEVEYDSLKRFRSTLSLSNNSPGIWKLIARRRFLCVHTSCFVANSSEY